MANEKMVADEVMALKKMKGEKKLELYRHLREKKVRIGQKIQMFKDIPDHIDTNITLDKEGKLHFPVFLLYD